MFPNRLTHLIDIHRGDIATGAILRIRDVKDVPHIQELSDRELVNWARGILVALTSWVLAGDDKRFLIQHNELGRVRFENSVPLYEVVRRLHILKCRVSGLIRDQAFAQNALNSTLRRSWSITSDSSLIGCSTL